MRFELVSELELGLKLELAVTWLLLKLPPDADDLKRIIF